MRRWVTFPYLGLLLLTRCVQLPGPDLLSPAHDQIYVCNRGPEVGVAMPMHRIVIVRSAANSPAIPREEAGSRHVVMDFGDGKAQILSPVRGSGDLLFANALYAWRLGQGGAILTDVAQVVTYNCHPAPVDTSAPALQ